MNGQALLEVRGLSIDSVRAGRRLRIVDSVDLRVNRGQFYGLVGESGSGKSISMMASVGLAVRGLEIHSGAVTFAGQEIPAADQLALRGNLSHGVSLLLQNARGALSPFLTVGRQVERVLQQRQSLASKTKLEVEELFRAVGLNYADLGRKYPHQISGGQAQRVAMVCALATDPLLLIADEPTTALDVTTERELLRFLTGICRERGMAVILIAHNLALVSEYCSGLAIMHAGQVVESGNLERIFANPLHPYTRGLIATVPDVDAARELEPIVGNVWGGPPHIERCRFSHRCNFASPRCDESRPPVIQRDGRQVHCVLYDGAVP